MAAFGLMIAVAIAGLVVDLGYAYYRQRELQKIADLSALSAVNDLQNAAAVANGIAARNAVAANLSLPLYVVETGTADPSQPGGLSTAAGGVVNAVRVVATANVDFFFMPGRMDLSAQATASNEIIAGFSAGSFLANVDTTQSGLLNGLLGAMLGGAANLTLVGYEGLASGRVRLGDLATSLGVGTVEELLTTDLTMSQLLTANAELLQADHPTAAAALNDLALTASLAETITLGEILKVDQSNPESAADTFINAFDLITSAAQLANKANFINLPLAVSLPGVLNANLSVAVIEPPVIAIGPPGKDADGEYLTEARTAQVRFRLTVQADVVGLAQITLPIYFEVASARVGLESAACGATPETSRVDLYAQASNLDLYLGQFPQSVFENAGAELPASAPYADLLNVSVSGLTAILLGGGLVTVQGRAHVDLQSGAGLMPPFYGPFDSTNTQSFFTSSLGLSRLLDDLQLRAMVAGIDKTGLVNSLLPDLLPDTLSAVTSLLGTLDSALIGPLLRALGVSTAGADVTVFSLDCQSQRLVH